MRILVCGGEDKEQKQLTATLQSLGHTLFRATAPGVHGATLQHKDVDLVTLLAARGSGVSLEWIRSLREELGAAPYVLVVADALPEETAIALYNAGADGDLRRPYGVAYLTARIEAVRRRIAPEKKGGAVTATMAAVVHSSREAPARTPLELVNRCATWNSAQRSLQDAASKFLTLPVRTSEGGSPSGALQLGASIILSNVEHELELRVAVGTDKDSAARLATHLFGPESDDLAVDMLTEVANIFMGALKTSFSAESLAFTGGLPAVVEPEHVLRPATTYGLQEAFSLLMEDAWLVVHLGVHSKARRLVAAAGLLEGMVLAKDLFNPKGLLLLNGGTRLSGNMIDRLRGILPPRHSVEVMGS